MSRNLRVMLTKCWYFWQCPVALVLKIANHGNHGWGTKKSLHKSRFFVLCSLSTVWGPKPISRTRPVALLRQSLQTIFDNMVDQITKTSLTHCTTGTGRHPLFNLSTYVVRNWSSTSWTTAEEPPPVIDPDCCPVSPVGCCWSAGCIAPVWCCGDG